MQIADLGTPSWNQDDAWSPSPSFGFYDNESPVPETPGTSHTHRNDHLPSSQPESYGELSFIALSDCGEDTTDEAGRPHRIQYSIEWRINLNHRNKAEDTEQNVVLAPKDYWNTTLHSKVKTVLQKKLPANKSFEADDTKVTVSVTGKRKLVKRYDGLDIDWALVDKQLRGWSDLLRLGKHLCISLSFNFVEKAAAPGTAGRQGPRTRTSGQAGSATELMLQELDGHRDASGDPSCWRFVYGLMRCPGPPCDVGPHCWRDSATKKRYKLRTRHMVRLVQYVRDGNVFETHDDVPEDLREQLYMEDQQFQERQNRGSQGKYPPINITNVLPSALTDTTTAVGSSPQTPPSAGMQPAGARIKLSIPGPLDAAVQDYCDWLASRVTRVALRREYQKVCDITLDEGLDLELVHEAQNPTFFVDKGVKLGAAQRFVRDIEEWTNLSVTGDDISEYSEIRV